MSKSNGMKVNTLVLNSRVCIKELNSVFAFINFLFLSLMVFYSVEDYFVSSLSTKPKKHAS